MDRYSHQHSEDADDKIAEQLLYLIFHAPNLRTLNLHPNNTITTHTLLKLIREWTYYRGASLNIAKPRRVKINSLGTPCRPKRHSKRHCTSKFSGNWPPLVNIPRNQCRTMAYSAAWSSPTWWPGMSISDWEWKGIWSRRGIIYIRIPCSLALRCVIILTGFVAGMSARKFLCIQV